jgi:rhodanese-related sulfurtransferase
MIWLHRVGLDRTVGFLKGGIDKWVSNGYTVDYIDQLNVFEALELMEEDDYVLIDTRDESGYKESHIEGSINIPSPDLRERYIELDTDKEYMLICNSGNRSSVGASILKMNDFDNVYNIAGGMKSYKEYLQGEE